MNRRFFLKLFPVVSAAVAIPAVTAVTSEAMMQIVSDPVASKWQGDGLYEVLDGDNVKILSVVRWSAYDDPNDGRCFRFSPRIPLRGGEIVYRYEYIIDDYLMRKVGEF
ncbi:hypothetical protein ABE530_17345 [Brucella sp. TWI559]